MRRLVPAAVGLWAAAILAAACQGLVGIEDSPPLRPDAGNGGDASLGGASGAGGSAGSGGSTGGASGASGAGGTAGAAGADAGCGSAQPPTATPGADTGGTTELVLAVRQIDLGDRETNGEPSWPTLGYDLDKLCTCGTDATSSCKAPNKVVCDGADGRDNSLGSFLYQVKTLYNLNSFSSEQLSQKIEGGSNTVLIRVRGYNETPDDGSVEVSWFASDDFQVTNPQPPKWDGTDAWPVLSSSLEPSAGADGGTTYSVENAKYVDKAAFVTNGTLVASLPKGSFALTSETSIQFTAALLTAKLIKAPGTGWTLEDGVLAGITRVGDVLGVLPASNDPITKQPICTDNLMYSGIKAMICNYPDMSILGTPAAACDYLSLGAGMRADPAQLGSVVTTPQVADPCAPGKNPKDDNC